MKNQMEIAKSYFLFALAILSAMQVNAQNIGVGTKNPQGALHVDGAKDNNASATPTVTEQANDFIVTPAGLIGVGTINPTHKLDVRGKIQIKDGRQGANSVLTTNADGLAEWRLPSLYKPVVNGSFPATSIEIWPTGYNSSPLYSFISITLSRGKWIVNGGFTFIGGPRPQAIFQRCYLSSSGVVLQQNGFTFLGPAGSRTSYGGIMMTGVGDTEANQQRGFITGSLAIEVTVPTVTLYVMLQNQEPDVYRFDAGRYLENYFFATPID